jgi:hypothetical protein
VLTTHAQSPEVSQTSVSTHLLQAFKIITEFRVDTVCENLEVLAIHNVLLSVEEPRWNLVLGGVLDDGNDAFKFFG